MLTASFVASAQPLLPRNKVQSIDVKAIPSNVWTKEPGIRIDETAFTANVLRLPNGILRMYYVSCSAGVCRVLSAISEDDGETWEKEPGSRLEPDFAPGGFVEISILNVFVLPLRNGRFRMYYATLSRRIGEDPARAKNRVFSALCRLDEAKPDLCNWEKEGLRLDVGATGALDNIGVSDPRVIPLPDGRFRMYYSGQDRFLNQRIFSAISADGLSWARESGVRIDLGPAGTSLDFASASQFAVIRLPNGMLRMYYTGGVIGPDFLSNPLRAILSAVSADGLKWFKEPGVSIDLGPAEDEAPDSTNVCCPSILQLSDGRFRMFYTGSADDFATARILSATAPRVPKPPRANAGPDRVANEGEVITFDGSNSFNPDGDPLSYTWDFGDSSDTIGQVITKKYADNGTFTVTLVVADVDTVPQERGGVDADTVAVTINNVPPLVDIAEAVKSTSVGKTLEVCGSFIDPGTADTHTATIDWGDGTPLASATVSKKAKTACGSHIYTQGGNFTVTLRVKDDDGGEGWDTIRITVHLPAGALGALPMLTLQDVKSKVMARHIVAFIAEGIGIKSIAVEIFDLRGRKIFSDEALSNELIWQLQSDHGTMVANGVYLYVVTVRGFDGSLIRREVRKLVVLR